MYDIKENICHVEGETLEGTIIDLETVGPIHNGLFFFVHIAQVDRVFDYSLKLEAFILHAHLH